MAKKKTSSNRKKNRKGAAGKANAADHHHGYEVSAYLQYLQQKRKAKWKPRETRLFPMYEYAEASNMPEVVLFKDDQSLRKAIKDIHSWNEADLLYVKDPRMWLFTIQDMLHAEDAKIFNKVFQGHLRRKWLEQTKIRAQAMVKSAITSERIHGVLIEGFALDTTVVCIFEMITNATADEKTKIRSHCEVMTYFTNVAKDTKEISGVTGNILHQLLVLSFFHLYDKMSPEVAFETLFRSEILGQVLRNITLPWISTDKEEILILTFFKRLCCPNASLHKMFKRGSPCHNALLDILEGRVHPCEENKFVMAELYSLKRFLDLRSFKPIDVHIPNPAIDKFRHTCTKCKKVDYSKQMLVCSKCKFVSYCSRECQVKDWKDHKADCSKFQNKECKLDRKFARKFLTKHQKLLIEKLKSTSLEAGLETMELVINLDFRASGHAMAPALRDPPEFEIAPVKFYLMDHTRSEQKAFIDSMIPTFGKNFVFVVLSFEDMDRGGFGAVQLQSDTFWEFWLLQEKYE